MTRSAKWKIKLSFTYDDDEPHDNPTKMKFSKTGCWSELAGKVQVDQCLAIDFGTLLVMLNTEVTGSSVQDACSAFADGLKLGGYEYDEVLDEDDDEE
jgi:hypothetical protein